MALPSDRRESGMTKRQDRVNCRKKGCEKKEQGKKKKKALQSDTSNHQPFKD
jgi:hypothetical protein